MKIKITPLILFLILLAVLILSMLLGSTIKSMMYRESFVNFNQSNATSYGNTIYVPQYSANVDRKIISLYDNIYIDNVNGNLLEVDGLACEKGNSVSGNTDCMDNYGTTITNIYVTTRDAIHTNLYRTQYKEDGSVLPYSTIESQKTSVVPTISQYSYTTRCETTDTYQVFYIAMNSNTFIHVMDIDKSTYPQGGANVISYALSQDGIVGTPKNYNYSIDNVPSYNTNPAKSNSDMNNGSLITDPNYMSGSNSEQIFQISPFLRYDTKNGYVLITHSNGVGYDVYDRATGSIVPGNAGAKEQIESLSSMTSMTIGDGNNGMALVCAIGKNTSICLIVGNSGDGSYKIVSCYSFDENGPLKPSDALESTNGNTWSNTTSGPAPTSSGGSPESGNNATTVNQPTGQLPSFCGDDISCKWFWYFNTMGQGNGFNKSGIVSNDHMLKTQLVPPFCPQCGEDGVCTNCGGNGGNGTYGLGKKGATAAGLLKGGVGLGKEAVNGAAGLGKEAVGGAAGLGKEAVGGAVDLGKEAVGGAVDLSKEAVGGAVDLGRETVGGAVDLSKETVGEAVDLGRETVGGAVGLGKEAVGGAVGLGKEAVGGALGIGKDLLGGIVGLGQDAAGGIVGLGQDAAGGLVGLGQDAAIRGGASISGGASNGVQYKTGKVDNYSRYGALPSKGGNYLPLTADFSKFGR